MFAAMQVFMAKETVAKMQWMSYGTELHNSLGSSVAKAYGGNGPDLDAVGETPKYSTGGGLTSTSAPTPAPPAAGQSATEPAAEHFSEEAPALGSTSAA